MSSKTKHILFFFLYSFAIQLIYAQSRNEPIYNKGIYNFISRQADKGIVGFFEDFRPMPRLQLAKKLLILEKIYSSNPIKFTLIERSQLDYYKKEYAFEINFIKRDTSEISEFLKFGKSDRFNVFKFYDKNFTFIIDPVFEIKYDFAKKNYLQFGGIQFSGRVSDFVGYYFSYRDFMEDGDNIDNYKLFTQETGVKNHRMKQGTHSEYSETRGGITLGWSWGNFTLAKDWLNIGSSYQSSVILSNKTPSFPHIRLEISPVKWFEYNFIHAWLDSKLIDSTSIRYTGVESELLKRSLSYSRRSKFYVAHTFSFMPVYNLWLTFGESIIYGDKLEPIYFIPVFFRLADHYNSIGGADTGDNAQIFFNGSYRWTAIESNFYFSWYIDEMSLSELIKGSGNNANVFAWTLGWNFNNPILNNNYITIEYNAVKPYAYMNADPIQEYSSSDYQLGHWIGSNAVQYYISMEHYILRSLSFSTYWQYIMKGSKEKLNDYYNRVTSTYPLLSGDVSYFSQAGIDISYNPLHDLYFELKYDYIFKANGRFEREYKIRKGASLSTSIRYGF